MQLPRHAGDTGCSGQTWCHGGQITNLTTTIRHRGGYVDKVGGPKLRPRLKSWNFFRDLLYMRKSSTVSALSDIAAAAKRFSLVGMLGWQDVRQRYRRSALGPLWLTISMGVMIGTIGIVFGAIFKSPMTEFLPFIAIGIILWSFISAVIMEGCQGFIAAESIIKQLPIPLFVHVMRMVWRNMLILGHNIVIFPLILIAVGTPLHMTALLAILGFLLLLANLTWMALILAVVCARYRDLAQIVTSALQVVFYLTPIMWMPKNLPKQAGLYLLDFNPVYHLLEVVRAPLLGEFPYAINWQVSCGLAIIGWGVAVALYGHYKRRIAYWL